MSAIFWLSERGDTLVVSADFTRAQICLDFAGRLSWPVLTMIRTIKLITNSETNRLQALFGGAQSPT